MTHFASGQVFMHGRTLQKIIFPHGAEDGRGMHLPWIPRSRNPLASPAIVDNDDNITGTRIRIAGISNARMSTILCQSYKLLSAQKRIQSFSNIGLIND